MHTPHSASWPPCSMSNKSQQREATEQMIRCCIQTYKCCPDTSVRARARKVRPHLASEKRAHQSAHMVFGNARARTAKPWLAAQSEITTTTDDDAVMQMLCVAVLRRMTLMCVSLSLSPSICIYVQHQLHVVQRLVRLSTSTRCIMC